MLKSLLLHLNFFSSECPLYQLQCNLLSCDMFWFLVWKYDHHSFRFCPWQQPDLGILKPAFLKWCLTISNVSFICNNNLQHDMTWSLSPKVPITSMSPICSSLLARIKSREAPQFSCPFLYMKQNCQHRESGSSIAINPRDIFAVIHMLEERNLMWASDQQRNWIYSGHPMRRKRTRATGRNWSDWVDQTKAKGCVHSLQEMKHWLWETLRLH